MCFCFGMCGLLEEIDVFIENIPVAYMGCILHYLLPYLRLKGILKT
jgi:hypothetical protein